MRARSTPPRPTSESADSVNNRTDHFEVVIIGGGISGIGAAIHLQRLGIDNFVLLEKADSLGGTWRANTYPGCACDVPSGLYSYSFAANPDWTRLFAEQPEIREYIEDTAVRHGGRQARSLRGRNALRTVGSIAITLEDNNFQR